MLTAIELVTIEKRRILVMGAPVKPEVNMLAQRGACEIEDGEERSSPRVKFGVCRTWNGSAYVIIVVCDCGLCGCGAGRVMKSFSCVNVIGYASHVRHSYSVQGNVSSLYIGLV